MLKSPVGRLRFIAMCEGVSFLILLFVAMPMKYWGGNADPVRWVGMLHGILFLLFCAALFLAARSARWTFLKVALVFVASLLPFGPFLIDRRLREECQAADA
jgi:integral membrane protein